MTSAPPLQAAKLWEKTSAKGNTYLVGRLDGVPDPAQPHRDAGTEGEPDWHLFFADGAPRTVEETPSSNAPPRRGSAYPRPQRSEAPSADPTPFNDEIPL
jgi:hypothetical protein